ncbi:MAG: DUF2723 domain-containing protein [Nitrospiraceae bacterium]|nr:DUF2723 domain-containing protein [Nitrospiraceae bacterium]
MNELSDLLPGGGLSPRLLIFFSSFSLILFYSLSPSVYPGDSGLVSTASFFLGSAHPPGYPLFVLLGKIFTFIPFGNVAFKVNLLAATSAATVALLVYEAALYITEKPVVSLLAPLFMLAAPNFILQSSMAKGGIYAFNSLLIMSVFYLGLRALNEEIFFKKVLMSAFIVGIGMGNHHTIGFMLIPLLYVCGVRRKDLPFGTVALSAVLLIVGLFLYFYIYMRSMAGAFLLYSPVYDFLDFMRVFLRADFSGSTLVAVKEVAARGNLWLSAVRNLWTLLSEQIHPALWIFVLCGFAAVMRKKNIFGYMVISLGIWVLLARMTTSANKMTFRDISVISPYFLPSIPVLAVIASVGVSAVQTRIKAHSLLISSALISALILFQAVFVVISFQNSTLSHYFVAYSWIKDISKVMKPKSFFLTFGDNPSFLSFYGFGVERLRDDVVVLDSLPGDNVFRLTLSPSWKYAGLYPKFYNEYATSVRYFGPIANEGRLYASNENSLPIKIRNSFFVRRYVLLFILLPKAGNPYIEKRFAEDFRKIDYLPLTEKRPDDTMEVDLAKSYFFTIWDYANLLAAENANDADYFYRLAIFLPHNNSIKFAIMRDYVKFLADRRGIAAAEEYLNEVRNSVSKNKEALKEIDVIQGDLKLAAGQSP